MSQRGLRDEDALARHMPGSSLDHGDIRFTIQDEPADVIVVLNYLKYDTHLTARDGYLWNWHNEPIVRTPFAKGFDRIFTHHSSDDPRTRIAPPILDWWIDKTYDQLVQLPPPIKQAKLSAIASTKEMIEGHKLRNSFMKILEQDFPEVSVFGEGRANQLEDKWAGLGPFEFSVAIENTSKPDYWTEKVADCFLSYAVPVYFGATNLDKYFPEKSFIWLPLGSQQDAIAVIEKVLHENSWTERNQAVTEARRQVLETYSLFGQIASRVRSEVEDIRGSKITTKLVHGRRVRKGGWVRGKGLLGNFEAWKNRRDARRSSHK